ncbi:MAG: 1-acyl-sn-glycerol-3-phosphate acyltransferase, partial [bacterium]|nr:1-acyl-sn-glycerol-3-phosphate acyltransferase [bacterium]
MMEFYDVARGVLAALFYSVWRLRVGGAERVPLRGPLILASNHTSYLDPPVLGCAAPRTVSYMAKSELFRIPLLGSIIGGLHAFPVERGKGDVAAIRT